MPGHQCTQMDRQRLSSDNKFTPMHHATLLYIRPGLTRTHRQTSKPLKTHNTSSGTCIWLSGRVRFEAWWDHSKNTVMWRGNRRGDKDGDWKWRAGELGGQRCVDEQHCGRVGDLWRWRVATSPRARPRVVVCAASGHWQACVAHWAPSRSQTPYKAQMKGGLWASLIPAHPCSMFCGSQPCLAEFHAGVFLQT